MEMKQKSILSEESAIKVYSQKDLLKIFPFRSTKLKQLLAAGALPVVKVGRTYLSSDELINRWLLDNVGKTIYY